MNQEIYYMKRLESFAFLLGALSIPSTFLLPIFAPFIFGSMAIVFAVLSKGGNLKFSPRARTACLLGIGAILLNIIYMVYAFKSTSAVLADPAARQQLSDTLYQRYGMTLDEFLEQIPGQSLLK